jgi:tetratricopeptide (TPR) repeat protein
MTSGRFRRLARLGSGSMGEVYRAYDLVTDTEVALKTLHRKDAEGLYQLKNEFRTLRGIRHTNLVELHELFVEDDGAFVTMELVDGRHFDAAIRPLDVSPGASWGAAALARLTDCARQLAVGLVAVHAAGTLHRDVKPSNVLVTPATRVVVLDFGLAVTATGAATDVAGDHLAGTFAYMPPEQAWGMPPVLASDWYAFGVVLYETLTGKLPFVGGDSREMLYAKMQGEPLSVRELVPDVPPALADLLHALLAARPQDRPAAAEILAALESASTARTTTSGRTFVGFVGRTEERDVLARVLAESRANAFRVIRVHGPSGIGKTALVEAFLTDVGRDVIGLRGKCHPREAVPYNAVDAIVDGLSRVLRGPCGDAVADLDDEQRNAVPRLFPVLGRVPGLAADSVAGDPEPHVVRAHAVSALRSLLTSIARTRPVVVWIDDVQWADVDGALLLGDLLQFRAGASVLFVLSYRHETGEAVGVTGMSLLQSRLDDLPPGTVIDLPLTALSAYEARSLIDGIVPADDTRTAEAVLSEAQGSPFFLIELARAAMQPGTRATGTAARLPSVVAARVRQLDVRAQRLLELVAVAGRPLGASLALSAAELASRDRRLLARMEDAALLRLAVIDGSDTAVEPYHDRIREAVLAQLDAGELRARHLALAKALTAVPDADPEALFHHHNEGGDFAAAARWAVVAADSAAATFAFDRASQLFRHALALDASAPHGPLQVRLGEALANAGRGAEAAAAFEAAAAIEAQGGDRLDVLALRRRAAEQYLRAGRVVRGEALLRAVLADVGVRFPDGPLAAGRASVVERLRMLLAGEQMPAWRAVPRAQRVRLETCWTGATTLSVVDHLAADGLGVRCLREASRAGDRAHVIRAIGLEAAREAALGGRFFTRRSQRLLARLDAIVDADDVYEQAWRHQSTGTAAYFAARWRSAFDHCERALAIFRERCRGTDWEKVTVESFALTALAHMGELRQLASRLPTAIEDADARDDLYASMGFRMGAPAIVLLADDQPAEARALADRAIAAWPPGRFLVQHYLHLVSTVQTQLYEGDGGGAWQTVNAAWDSLRTAGILIIGCVRVELLHLRGRAALAALRSDPARYGRVVGDVRRIVRRLRRERLPSAATFADLLAAGLAVCTDRRDEVLSALAIAGRAADAADLHLHAAAAAIRAADGAPTSHRTSAARAARAWLDEQGVRRPEAFVGMVAPGW